MADEVAFGSKEWLDAYVTMYNSRPELQEALKDLCAKVAYEFSDRPDIAPKYVYIDCGVVKEYGEVGDGGEMEYIIRANYDIWKAMTLGELDPMNALMAGKVKVTGNMAALLKHAEGFKQTFEVVEAIPTTFD
ncbi:MAG TPA: SCP2 sterol-binding domain-containing protein [Candidatus Anoxymicrobiaceae bacterium]|jgi:putative sterol carrier protein